MGHYDDAYEQRYEEERKAELAYGRRTIGARLKKLATALRTLGMSGAKDIEEAIEHLKTDA